MFSAFSALRFFVIGTAAFQFTAALDASPIVEGTIPFSPDGETYETWYRAIGSLDNTSTTPLIVLHGGPALSHDYLIPISDLAKTRPVIFYDQLGNARSTHLPDKTASFWTIDLFIDELVNLIQNFQIEDNFDILGHSWGGILASEFLVRRKPAGLKHLVLTNSLASMELWNDATALLLSQFPKDVQEGMTMAFENKDAYAAAMKEFYAVHGCTLKPVPSEFIYSLNQIIGPEGDMSVAIGLFGGDLQSWSIIDRLDEFHIPTLVINGKEDIAQDFVVEPFVRGISGAKWVKFQNSSHTPMWEERRAYMDALQAFLDG